MPDKKTPQYILTINPGSTSTKVALFAREQKIAQDSIHHTTEELKKYNDIWDQLGIRYQAIEKFLSQNYFQGEMAGVVGRGGLLKPLRNGTYQVNDQMIKDARQGLQGVHISNIGCALAQKFADKFHCNAYVVDPVSVDEFSAITRLSGHPLIQRHALSHALSIRASTFRAAAQMHIDSRNANFIVTHLGGGISIAAVERGRIIDVNDASSDGPFSPERTGSLPLQSFIDICFSGKYTENEIRKMVMGKGGMVAYLGTNDLQQVEQMVDAGDRQARLVYEAMAYQIAKEIGSMACVLSGRIDAIILTGGMAQSNRLIVLLTNRVKFIAPTIVIKGELEMEAMANGLLRVLNGQENCLQY